MTSGPLYLGFDLSTQQLKGLVIDGQLRLQYQAIVDFDEDAKDYGVQNGVLNNEEEHEVYAPVAMWLRAFDLVMDRLKEQKVDFSRVKGISGAGMQHGSVYWSFQGEEELQKLDGDKPLEEQLHKAFSYPYSPNWQDASTQVQCDQFDRELGDPKTLASITGSKAHHRFTGPQILRLRVKYPQRWADTSRISLVSSFAASIMLGKIAPLDISDVCGMNLWNLREDKWDDQLLSLASGGDAEHLRRLLHDPCPADHVLGPISPYFVRRYGFPKDCSIAPFTGDNPSTILALPLQPLDAIVSLGTSTTFLMSTPAWKPDPAVHFFNHPTSRNLYMFMLCYKNGGLAREQVRDALNRATSSSQPKSWDAFNKAATESAMLGQKDAKADPIKVGLYFPKPEIVPNVHAGMWRYAYDQDQKTLSPVEDGQDTTDTDPRAIIESQLLSLRLRSLNLVHSPGDGLPPQPRRIYLVGGGSVNPAIARIAGEVLGGKDGVYRLDVGGNACALGATHRACWAVEKEGPRQRFEDFIAERWDEDRFVKKVADGYQRGVFERYALGVEALKALEEKVLREQAGDGGK